MRSLFEKLDRLDRDVRRRDVREYVAACVVMAFFGWQAAVATEPLARLGALIVVFGSMFIIVWSRRSAAAPSRQAFTADLPIVQFCARELDRIESQVRLLKSVWWWYLGPTITGVLLMLLARDQSPTVKGVTVMIVFAVAALIHYANVWTAKHELEPLRDELAAHLDDLRRTA